MLEYENELFRKSMFLVKLHFTKNNLNFESKLSRVFLFCTIIKTFFEFCCCWICSVGLIPSIMKGA